MSNIADYIKCNKLIPQQDLNATLNREAPSLRNAEHEHCNLQDSIPECLAVSSFYWIPVWKEDI